MSDEAREMVNAFALDLVNRSAQYPGRDQPEGTIQVTMTMSKTLCDLLADAIFDLVGGNGHGVSEQDPVEPQTVAEMQEVLGEARE